MLLSPFHRGAIRAQREEVTDQGHLAREWQHRVSNPRLSDHSPACPTITHADGQVCPQVMVQPE